MKLFRILPLIFLFCISLTVSAQVQDFSNLRVSQLTDQQLQQYLNQAKGAGYGPEQVEKELLNRGLPQSELAELRIRVQKLQTNNSESPAENPPSQNSKRSVTAPASSKDDYVRSTSRIFGSELFSNVNLSFEPDLRMPTPKDYIIGPDDELNLHVYGVNISQQTLKVSPEGNVNVKYAGIVNLNGLSIEAAASVLKNKLAKYYPALNNGQTKLQLSLGNIRSIRVILIGAVNKPGTYSLPSLASLFNALYVSGGPAENGSFRNIELIRNNKVIKKADLYDFLTKGDLSGNLRLEDNDVIRIPYADLLVTLEGQLNRPGIFELKKNENLQQAIEFAGGFKSKAFKGRITGSRFASLDRKVLDISGDSIKHFLPVHGDEYFIDSVINRYQNKVVITGAVFKPGTYAFENGMTIRQLIMKAQGLKEDVFTGRALLVRTRADLTKEYISVELKPIVSGETNGLLLQKEDSLRITSLFDLRDSAVVTINGAVRKPGTFRYEENLSLKSLIMMAEGFSDQATGSSIEISRRKKDVDVHKSGSEIVELIYINDSKELSNNSADVTLMPFDIVTIKEDPFYKKQINVKVSGEVLMPALYTLQSREERLSSLIKRSGGLLYTANIAGAKLIRVKKGVIDTTEIKRLFSSVAKDSTNARINTLAKNTTEVAIDLGYILKNPGSRDDITLEEGDELIIPRINNTVSVNGEVFKPLDIMFDSRKKMKDYLSDAGGVTQAGKKGKAFVIYANGSSAQIKKTLGLFNRYPQIEPGSNIYVPAKPKKEGIDLAKAGILISALTALVTTLSLIYR